MAMPATGEEGGMLADVFTGAAVGMDGTPVEFELAIAQAGFPNSLIVRLRDSAVKEARERVRAAR